MAVAVVDIQVNSQGAVSRIRDVNNAAKQAQQGINQLKTVAQQLSTAFDGLVVASAAFNAQRIATSFITAANAANAAQSRIKLVSQGFDDYRSVLQVAQSTATRFGISQTQAATAIADIYTRLRPVGFQLNEINAIYEGFNTAVKLSGTSADAASSAFLQLSQGLGSGALQGDELRSVLEQIPAVAQAIATELKTNVGNIKEFGSQGKITSDVILRALDRIRTEGAGKLAEALDTPQQRIIDLQNAFEDLKIEVGSAVAPLVVSSIKEITAAIKEATSFVGNLKSGFDILANTTSGVSLGIGNIDSALGGVIGRFNELGRNKGLMMLLDLVTLGGASILGGIAGIGEKRKKRQGYEAPAGPEIPLRLSRQGRTLTGTKETKRKGRTGKSDAEQAAEAAAKEAERVSEVIRNRLAEGQVLRIKSELQDKISAAEMSGDKMLVARLQGQQKQIDLQVQYAKELANEKNIKAQQAIIFEGQSALVASQRDVERELAQIQSTADQERLNALQAAIEKQYQLNTGIQQQLQLADSVSNALGQGLTSAFDALIQGSDNWAKSLQAIASGVLVDIAKQLIRIFIIEQAVSAIKAFLTPFSPSTPLGAGGGQVGRFGTLGPNFGIRQFAAGGTPPVGRPSIVGERGPELFMPGVRGTIIPNNAMGGGSTNVVVNVDASGSSVQGDQQQAKQLGLAVSAAVQAELIKQKRPGGLLA